MSPRKQGNGARGTNGDTPSDTRNVARLAQQAADGTLLYATKNPLPAETRADAVKLLNNRLADCIDLQSQTKQAHWNVKGPMFIGLHKLFDEIYEATGEYVDLIAERVVQLGGIAEGTTRVAAQRSSLSEYPLVISTGEEHVAAMSDVLAEFSAKARAAIDELEELEDPDSMDILTEVSRGVDQWLWFVEAHQQTRPASTEGRSQR
ncbi:MAG TPA: DNA starvation/stationary phase protection protein Dps [Gemmatimonadaceae bacterium]|nr:DNA starvation/stationary phase protection protein Dps [Gemmatimonadaceae bacterium]